MDDSEMEARFWAKVDKRGPDECWPWKGSVVRQERGRFYARGRMETAPRVALALARGAWLESGEWALHRCDNPNCVNPAHLWVGTALENTLDAVAKGRFPHAVKTHCAQGHLLEGNNLKFDTRGTRICLICRRAAARRSQNRIRGHREKSSTKAKYRQMADDLRSGK